MSVDEPTPSPQNGHGQMRMAQKRDGTLVVAKMRCNVEIFMATDPTWGGRVYYDLFRHRMMLLPEEDGGELVQLQDEHIREIARDFFIQHDVEFSLQLISDGIWQAALSRKCHPLQEYLNSVVWDGVPRVEGMLRNYMKCEGPLVDLYSRKFMIAAVARAMKPGCQVDTCLTLKGKQGAGKSTAWRVLASPEYFKDTHFQIGNKDAYQQLSGAWLYELGEMDHLRKTEISAVKAFMTSRVDDYRRAYGRLDTKQKRGCVFVASTNEAAPLNDSTGSRRFWIVQTTGKIDIEGLRRDRDLLWAEAVHMYRNFYEWWLTPAEQEQSDTSNLDYNSSDPWFELVRDYVMQRTTLGVTEGDILEHLEIPTANQNKLHMFRVQNILQQLQWVKGRRRVHGRQKRAWFPSATEAVS